MGLRVNWNPSQLEINIQQIGARAMKGMSDRMRKSALKVRDLAREYAPVKTGLLEDSINMLTTKGQNNRNVFTVYIDLDANRRGAGRSGELGDYAYIMEEQLKPYGRGKYNLGWGSLLKAASSGRRVGGKFLARAMKEGTQGLINQLAAEVRRVTNGSRIAPVAYVRDTGDDE